MRARLAQYSNDIVCLSILILWSIALFAGPGGAALYGAAEPVLEDPEPVLVIDIDLSFRQHGE